MLKEKIKYLVNGVARRLFHTNIQKLHYLKQDIDIDSVNNFLKQRYLPVKELVYEDFLLGDVEHFDENKLESIKKRLADGYHIAYGIVEDGKLLCSAWLSLQTISLPVESYSTILDVNEGYLEDDYCSPLSRGQGYHKYLINYRLSKLYGLDRTSAIIVILDGNVPSLRNAIKAGFKDIGFIYCGKILGIPFVNFNKEKYDYR